MNDLEKYVQRQIDQEAEHAITALEKLAADALRARDDIVAGQRPFMMMGGGTGIERSAADADRHIYHWFQMNQLKGLMGR